MCSSRAVPAILAAQENIGLIRTWASGRTLEDLQSDTMVRDAIERAFIALDAALRDIPTDIVATHDLPARPVAGFRNALAHTYEDILDERVILTIDESLPELDAKLALILEQVSENP